MAWGGNHLEPTKEEYIKQIQDMTGENKYELVNEVEQKGVKTYQSNDRRSKK